MCLPLREVTSTLLAIAAADGDVILWALLRRLHSASLFATCRPEDLATIHRINPQWSSAAFSGLPKPVHVS